MNDPQLLSELSSIINLIKKECDEDAFVHHIDIWLEKYEIWPSLQRIYLSLQTNKHNDHQALDGIAQSAQTEIDKTYEFILLHDKFSRTGLGSTPCKSTTSLRRVVADAFASAGLGYYNPHSFRDVVIQLG